MIFVRYCVVCCVLDLSIHVDEIMEQCIPELLIKEFTKEEYNRAIDLITNKYKVDREKIINTSNQYYSLEKGVEKYKEIYNKILN